MVKQRIDMIASATMRVPQSIGGGGKENEGGRVEDGGGGDQLEYEEHDGVKVDV